MIRGGHEYEFFRRVLPDDCISVTWRLEDISEHKSSSGGSMLVVISSATYASKSGELLARNRETLIFQPLERS